MEIIQVGDLHLIDTAGVGGLAKYVENQPQMVLDELQVVNDYAVRSAVRHIVLAGDLCDGPRMAYEAQMALDDFLIRNNEVVWHLYLGNHDMFSFDPKNGHSLEILQRLHRGSSHVRFYTRPTTKVIGGQRVQFLPYPHTTFKRGALNFFHNEVRGAKNDAGKTFDSDELSDSKAVAIGGHLHTAHRIRNTWYSGTLYQTNFGERLPKYFHHIEYRSDKDYEVRRVPHDPQYKLFNVVINSRQDLDQIPEGQNNLVKLIIQDGADVSTADITRYPNIVEHKNFKTKEDLVAVLTEDISEGQKVTFKVSEFFKVWIESYDVPDEMRERIRLTRKRVLSKVKESK